MFSVKRQGIALQALPDLLQGLGGKWHSYPLWLQGLRLVQGAEVHGFVGHAVPNGAKKPQISMIFASNWSLSTFDLFFTRVL